MSASASFSDRFSAAARVSSALHDALQPVQVVLLAALLGRAHVLLALVEGGGDRGEALGERRVDLADAADRLPFAPQRLPLAAHRGVLGGDEPLGFRDHRRRLGGELPALLELLVATLGRTRRVVEATLHVGGPGLGHRRQPFPLGASGGQPRRHVVAGQGLDALAQSEPFGLLLTLRLETARLVGAAGLVGGHGGADAVRERLELLDDRRADLGVGEQLHPRDPGGGIAVARRRRVARPRERLHLQDQRPSGVLIGVLVFDRRGLGRDRSRRQRGEQRLGALGRGLGPGPLRDRRELVGAWRRQPVERSDRGVGVLAVGRHRLEFGGVGEAFEGEQSRPGVLRMARHAAQGLGLGEQGDRRVTGGLGRRRAGQRGELAGAGERPQRRDGPQRVAPGRCGQRGQPLHGGIAHAGLGVVAADGRERVRVGQSGHGGAADAHVGVVGGHLAEHVGGRLLEGLNGLETDGRVAVLPSGLGSELVENAHGFGRAGLAAGSGRSPLVYFTTLACSRLPQRRARLRRRPRGTAAPPSRAA